MYSEENVGLYLTTDKVELGAVAGMAAQAVRQVDADYWQTVLYLWSTIIALPTLILLIGLIYSKESAGQAGPKTVSSVAAISYGLRVWLAFSPLIYLVYVIAISVSVSVGIPYDEHPIALVASRAGVLDKVILVFAVAIAVPCLEELLFRRVVIGWLMNAEASTVFIWVVGIGLGWLIVNEEARSALIVFIVLALLLQFVAITMTPAKVRREMMVIGASGFLFAVVHAGVWPTPLPLLVLGVALGWLYLRTGSVLACTITHGLFNLVSLIVLLSA